MLQFDGAVCCVILQRHHEAILVRSNQLLEFCLPRRAQDGVGAEVIVFSTTTECYSNSLKRRGIDGATDAVDQNTSATAFCVQRQH